MIIPEKDAWARLAELKKFIETAVPGTAAYNQAATWIALWESTINTHYPNSKAEDMAGKAPQTPEYGQYIHGQGTVFGDLPYPHPWQGAIIDAPRVPPIVHDDTEERRRYWAAKGWGVEGAGGGMVASKDVAGTVTPIGQSVPVVVKGDNRVAEARAALEAAQTALEQAEAASAAEVIRPAGEGHRRPYNVPPDAKVGLCIATHGSAAYVRLNLRARDEHETNTPILIHDDHSGDGDLMLIVMEHQTPSDDGRYHVENFTNFYSTPERKPPTVGDMSSFYQSLAWGRDNGLDIVVKCSRRMILAKPWVDGLVELMHNTGYATATAPCAHFSFGFRSELVAMAVTPWWDSGAAAELGEHVRLNRRHGLPEALYHDLARRVHLWNHPKGPNSTNPDHPEIDYTLRSEEIYGRKNGGGGESWDAYAFWPIMGMSRMSKVPGILWHDSHTPADYAQLAKSFGLNYTEADFTIIPGE